jgi:hypothetical protein
MNRQQTAYRPNASGERDLGQRHNLSPRYLRVAEVELAEMATKESLRALHGVHVAAAAGAAVGSEQMAMQESAFTPASPEVRQYAAQQAAIPQSPEVQRWAAQQAAAQSVSAQAQGF